MGCTEGEKRDWSVRAFHEALSHTQKWTDPDTKVTTAVPQSSIVTLTYDEENLPPDGYLHYSDFQLFIKKLRRSKPKGLRMYMCGEYGGKTSRPHFHSVIYGYSFDDRYADDDKNQQSYELDEIWGKGRATVDDFTYAGAAYVAGYVSKKMNTYGLLRPHHATLNKQTNRLEMKEIAPEFRKMSTHPGLGHDYIMAGNRLEKIYESDQVKVGEWTFHPPRYYDTLFKRKYPKEWPRILAKRQQGQIEAAETWSPERCAAAEAIQFRSVQRRSDSL